MYNLNQSLWWLLILLKDCAVEPYEFFVCLGITEGFGKIIWIWFSALVPSYTMANMIENISNNHGSWYPVINRKTSGNYFFSKNVSVIGLYKKPGT